MAKHKQIEAKRNSSKSIPSKGPYNPFTGASASKNGAKAPYATISHTLPLHLVEHLRAFAHYQRVSASSVIEFAVLSLFKARDDEVLGATLRRKGAGPRRKPSK